MKHSLHLLTFATSITVLFCSSCANLHAVNNFAGNSSASLSNFTDIKYSFQQHCMLRCEEESIDQMQIKRTLDCDCSLYKTADSVTTLIYLSLKNYFASLAAFTSKDLRHTDFSGLNANLVAGTFGDVQITQQQADAYTGIANLLTDATTAIYRKNKVKKYISKSNAPIQVLLDKLQFILKQNLSSELDFKKEKLYDRYQELIRTGNINNYEKQKATSDYYQQLNAVNDQQTQITLFANSLQDIASGHQKLFDNLNRLKEKPLADSLSKLQSAMQSNTVRFNKIKI